MRVAALYDIHGNLPALEGVLHEIRQANADRIVVGGDVIPGPMPHETLQRLLEIDTPIHFIVGNSESEVLAQMKGRLSDTVPDHCERFCPGLHKNCRQNMSRFWHRGRTR